MNIRKKIKSNILDGSFGMKNKFSEYKTISMQEFIENYLNVKNNDDNSIENINHYDITDLNLQGVTRVPNDIVTDDDIKTGRIILVEASGAKHQGKMICAYLRPDIVLYKEKEMTKIDEMIINALYKDDCKKLRRKKKSN